VAPDSTDIAVFNSFNNQPVVASYGVGGLIFNTAGAQLTGSILTLREQ